MSIVKLGSACAVSGRTWRRCFASSVVDDDPSLRHMYHRALGGRGFAVTAAPSGPKALDLLGEGFSVIVTDFGMPEMNGLEFIREVRARGLDTPVLIVSGEFDAGVVNGGLPPGVVAVLSKPFLIEELLCAVRRACDRAAVSETQSDPPV